jgi:RHS repeat-associated protein
VVAAVVVLVMTAMLVRSAHWTSDIVGGAALGTAWLATIAAGEAGATRMLVLCGWIGRVGTVSADLGRLAAFVSAANELLGGGDSGTLGLRRQISELRKSYDEYQESGSLFVANDGLMGAPAPRVGPMVGELDLFVSSLERGRLFVEAVRRALEAASGATDGAVTVDQAAFDRALVVAVSAVAAENGLTPAVLLAHMQISVDDPVAAGVPQSSGFVNDPVCTATGHFVEVAEDFTWPERLGVLRWRRVYSSRFMAPGPFGRGWASWASVACVAQGDGSVRYQGPDGQLAVFTPDATTSGFARVAGVAATLRALPGPQADAGEGISRSGAASWAASRGATARGSGPASGAGAASAAGMANSDGDGGGVPSPGDVANSDGDGVGVGRAGVGWELVWDWESARPGDVWRFDALGRLVSVWGPATATARFEYAGGRLVAIAHDSGRRLEVVWDGARVVGVRSSCGRVARYRYSDAGDLVGCERAVGDRVYVVDEHGLIVEVWDADGIRLCRNSYDGEGRVVLQVTPFGRETVLAYLPGGRTVVSDTGDGPVAVYAHDSVGRLVGVVDHLGHGMERRFDAEGRCVAATGFDRGTTHSSFGADGRSATVVGADGVVERWDYDDRQRVRCHQMEGGPAVSFEYVGEDVVPTRVVGPDGWEMRLEVVDGLLRSLTDADGVTVGFDHDGDGNVVAMRNGLGAVTRIEPHPSGEVAALTTPEGERFEFDRDPAGRLLAVRTPLGDQFRCEWSAGGRLRALVEPNGARTEFAAGSHGELQRIVDAVGSVVELEHDQLARLVGVAAPGGAKWGFEYTALGLLSLVCDPAGGVWRYDYDAEGRLVAATDPLGRWVRQRYNPAGRLVELVDRAGNATRYGRDALGRVLREEGPEGAAVAYGWDLWGRPVLVRFPDGDSLRYWYTPAGRVAGVETGQGRAWSNAYDQAGRLIAVTDPAGATTRFEWDTCDRLVAAVSPGGRVDRFRYDGLGRVVETERAGRVWRTDYDHAGRALAVTDPGGATTCYRYDLAGRLVAATDPLGHTVRVRYDERGNPSGLVDPFGGLVTTSYDAMRRPVATTDQLGRTTRLERDAAGRVVRQRLATGDVVEWRRDPRGLTTDIRVNGRDTVVVDRDRAGRPALIHEPARNRTIGLAWTPGGRLRSLDSDGRQTRWEHNCDGQVTARHDPAGRATRYTHDPLGRLATVTVDPVGQIHLERDPDGQLVALHGFGIERRWDHDEGGLIDACHLSGPERNHTTEITRDAAGHVTETRTPSGVTRYRYDPAGQLVAASRGTDAWEWHYDPAGRLTREDGPQGTRRYTYDDAHQLVHVDTPHGRTSYQYDAAGRRTHQTGPTGTRHYTWDPLGHLIAIDTTDPLASRHQNLDTTNPLASRHHNLDIDALGRLADLDATPLDWDPTTPIPELLAIGDRHVITVDGTVLGSVETHGTPTWLPGEGRGTTSRGDGRDPWGAATHHPPNEEPSLGYLGEVDIDGLVWLRNRVYDPASRQFLSPDPLPGIPGLAVATNPYHYANNNPVGYVDPLGLQGQPLSIGDYTAYREQAYGWKTENLVTVGLVAAGVAMMFIPGLGLVGAGVAGTVLGFAGGAAPGIIHGIETGQWDWGAIMGGAYKGAVIGGIGGLGGGGLGALARGGGPLSGVLTGSTRASTALRGGVAGAGLGAGGGTSAELYDLTPLPGSDGQFNPEGIVVNTVLGGTTGTIGGAITFHPTATPTAPARPVEVPRAAAPLAAAPPPGITVTYRGDWRPPSSIFEQGFTAVGTDMSLVNHVRVSLGSGYVGTSMSFFAARSNGPYVYEIRAPGGINVNAQLGPESVYTAEQEFAFPHRIEPHHIYSVDVDGTVTLNPNYREPE